MIPFRQLPRTINSSLSTSRRHHRSFHLFRRMATSNGQDFPVVASSPSTTATTPREENETQPDTRTAKTTNKEVYSVFIQNDGTHMKVFMPSHLQQQMAAINQKHTTVKRPRIENQSKKNQDKTISCLSSNLNDNNTTTNATNTAATNNESSTPPEDTAATTTPEIPESVRHYERQLRKMQAATRASTSLSADDLQIVYNDPHIVVVNKPSGFLTVPGVNNNPNLLSLVYKTLQERDEQDAKILQQLEKMEHMIVHRLDMDTSGLVMFAKTKESMAQLQASFRQGTDQSNNKKKKWKNRKKQSRQETNGGTPVSIANKPIQKEYEALLCGHLSPATVESIQIDLPLQRDHEHPPFMRVATPTSEQEAKEVVRGLNHAGWKKIVKKNAKPSQTILHVLKREHVKVSRVEKKDNGETSVMDGMDSLTIGDELPVTRVRLVPVTGRTHQLRVHCAAIGHPILADPTYGVLGEASPNGGFDTSLVNHAFSNIKNGDSSSGGGSSRALTKLELQLDQWAKDHDQVMCLHARKLQLNHPTTGAELCLEEVPKF